ncbi:histidine kinase/DNA gyrase B/HSP90-like ATPase [Chitinophaga polysaccharea]|uniref:histidine kinase n=1 Tax=Chitinophaga polysaccharea TaxID=1293035 RepID=A0A561P0V1_9BACT|nr:ATP-binding protein [Chitinophaga polysaccharea]TWF31738.1 histidine kinase/DNA gyrase B/HSP90-like ATPase [Chitinophaga polysaccharea]
MITEKITEQNLLVKERVLDLLKPLIHDISKPINNMSAAQQELLRAIKTGDQDTALDLLKSYFTSVEVLKAIIFRVNEAASQVEKYGPAKNDDVVSLYELFKNIELLFRPTLRKKQMRLNRYLDNDFPITIHTDSTFLLRILINFIDNSLKHGNVGGRIELKAQQHPPGKYSITITDNGPGLPSDPHTDGQGLIIVKDLVTAMNGTLETTSSKHGTTHTLIFPLIVWI